MTKEIKLNNEEKVYCERCKHNTHDKERNCKHPSNMTDDWYSSGSSFRDFASALNRNNDCPNYEEMSLEQFRNLSRRILLNG